MTPRTAVVGLVTLLAMALWSPRADACDCSHGGSRWVMADGAVLPSNAKALAYLPWQHANTSGACDALRSAWERERNKTFVVERLRAGGAIPVAHHVEVHTEGRPHNLHRCAIYLLVTLDEPLVPGARYRFVGPFHRKPTITVSVSPRALSSAAASSLVRPAKRTTLQVPAGGSCRRDVELDTVEGVLTLPPRARPFREALMFTAKVDGRIWRPASNYCGATDSGRSRIGLGEELFYTPCDWTTELKGNAPLTLQMTATLPGTDVTFVSPPVELVLPCQGTPRDMAVVQKQLEEQMQRVEAKQAAGKAAMASSASAPPTSTPPATTPPPTPAEPAAPSSPTPVAGPAVPPGGGCGACATTPLAASGGWSWALLLPALCLARRFGGARRAIAREAVREPGASGPAPSGVRGQDYPMVTLAAPRECRGKGQLLGLLEDAAAPTILKARHSARARPRRCRGSRLSIATCARAE
jgi:hypothetical protein